MSGKVKKIKEGIGKVARDLSLTASWMKTKDADGKYSNLRASIEDVSSALKSLAMGKLVLSTTLMACIAGSSLAYKKEFWTDQFDSYEETLTNKFYLSEDERVRKGFIELASERFVQAHRDAAYKKYMIRTAIGTNVAAVLGVCWFAAGKRRREEEAAEKSLDV